eukprot:gene9281-1669_t
MSNNFNITINGAVHGQVVSSPTSSTTEGSPGKSDPSAPCAPGSRSPQPYAVPGALPARRRRLLVEDDATDSDDDTTVTTTLATGHPDDLSASDLGDALQAAGWSGNDSAVLRPSEQARIQADHDALMQSAALTQSPTPTSQSAAPSPTLEPVDPNAYIWYDDAGMLPPAELVRGRRAASLKARPTVSATVREYTDFVAYLTTHPEDLVHLNHLRAMYNNLTAAVIPATETCHTLPLRANLPLIAKNLIWAYWSWQNRRKRERDLRTGPRSTPYSTESIRPRTSHLAAALKLCCDVELPLKDFYDELDADKAQKTEAGLQEARQADPIPFSVVREWAQGKMSAASTHRDAISALMLAVGFSGGLSAADNYSLAYSKTTYDTRTKTDITTPNVRWLDPAQQRMEGVEPVDPAGLLEVGSHRVKSNLVGTGDIAPIVVKASDWPGLRLAWAAYEAGMEDLIPSVLDLIPQYENNLPLWWQARAPSMQLGHLSLDGAATLLRLKGQRVGKTSFGTVVKTCAADMGVQTTKTITGHTPRCSLATEMAANGASNHDIARRGGWTATSHQVERYVRGNVRVGNRLATMTSSQPLRAPEDMFVPHILQSGRSPPTHVLAEMYGAGIHPENEPGLTPPRPRPPPRPYAQYGYPAVYGYPSPGPPGTWPLSSSPYDGPSSTGYGMAWAPPAYPPCPAF